MKRKTRAKQGHAEPASASKAEAARDEPGKPAETELADKAVDLEALLQVVADAAKVGSALWLSYLFLLFFLLVAAAGVTHRDLFLENPVALPFLSISFMSAWNTRAP